MKYSIKQLKQDFPTDEACLDYIFKLRYPQAQGYYRVRARKCYSHKTTKHQIHPLADTIFHKSSTSLVDWFFAIYLMSASKNGVSAKELERHLGVTYKTAWRIGHQIRSLMEQDINPFSGVIEADETYMGGVRKGGHAMREKIPVIGIVQRGGGVKAKKVDEVNTGTLIKNIADNVEFGSRLMSDEHAGYKKVPRLGLLHDYVTHSKREYGRGDVHTNTIEGFWSQMKRSIDGTYHAVSSKHLQKYVDEFAYGYSHRSASQPLFLRMLASVVGKPYEEDQKMLSVKVLVWAYGVSLVF